MDGMKFGVSQVSSDRNVRITLNTGVTVMKY